jgi:hypothetical protein
MLNQIIKPVSELNFSVKKDANQQEVRNYIETHFPTRSGCELKELSRVFHIINDNIETACGRGLSYCIIPLNEIVKGVVPQSVSVITNMRMINDIETELKLKGYKYTFVTTSKFDKNPRFIAISLSNNNDVNEEMYDEIRNVKKQYMKNDCKSIAAVSLIVAILMLIATI